MYERAAAGRIASVSHGLDREIRGNGCDTPSDAPRLAQNPQDSRETLPTPDHRSSPDLSSDTIVASRGWQPFEPDATLASAVAERAWRMRTGTAGPLVMAKARP
jgi:hypothetical protein